ncbi:MAG: esterase [Frankiales bacterium]|nr:esterase [Frankiales bacterium]
MDVRGQVEPRFARVRDVFEENWSLFDELGASVAATVDGVPVVDLWGGWADAARTRPWESDTLVLVASTTKGLTGLCANMLIERGLLDPAAPVADYWPEFAAAGKQDVLVQHVFDHRAGLPDVPAGADPTDWDAMVEGLAAAAPSWPAGTAHAYHSVTFGHLLGELVRRTSGRTVGTFLREEVCEPLGADAWIGLPVELDDRVAELVGAGAAWSSEAFRRNEVPAANCITHARALARIYAPLACGGDLDGVHLLDAKTIDAATSSSVSGRWYGWTDEMLAAYGVPESVFEVRFARGFALSNSFAWMGPNPEAFGSGGSGGSLAFADPVARVSFAYAQNAHLGQGQEVGSRSGRLVQALYDALAR